MASGGRGNNPVVKSVGKLLTRSREIPKKCELGSCSTFDIFCLLFFLLWILLLWTMQNRWIFSHSLITLKTLFRLTFSINFLFLLLICHLFLSRTWVARSSYQSSKNIVLIIVDWRNTDSPVILSPFKEFPRKKLLWVISFFLHYISPIYFAKYYKFVNSHPDVKIFHKLNLHNSFGDFPNFPHVPKKYIYNFIFFQITCMPLI